MSTPYRVPPHPETVSRLSLEAYRSAVTHERLGYSSNAMTYLALRGAMALNAYVQTKLS
jgi:hypothetical protein